MSDERSSDLKRSPHVKTTPDAMAEVYSVDSILNIQRDMGSAISRLDRVEKDMEGVRSELKELNGKADQIASSLNMWKLAGGVVAALVIFLFGSYANGIIQWLASLNQ